MGEQAEAVVEAKEHQAAAKSLKKRLIGKTKELKKLAERVQKLEAILHKKDRLLKDLREKGKSKSSPKKESPSPRDAAKKAPTKKRKPVRGAVIPKNVIVKKGCRVVLDSLQRGTSLNGTVGTVIEYVKEKKKYRVTLDSPEGKTIIVKSDNLRVIDCKAILQQLADGG